MRLAFAKLAFELGRRLSLATVSGDPSQILQLPILYKQGMLLSNNSLYIVRSIDLPLEAQNISKVCLICLGDPPPHYHSAGYSLIVVGEPLEPIEAYNIVREVFLALLEWDEGLRSIVEHRGSIQELLDVSSPVFDNMLCVSDENIKLLAASYQGCRSDTGAPLNIYNHEAAYKKLASRIRRVTESCFTLEVSDLLGMDKPFTVLFIHIQYEEQGIGALSIQPLNRPAEEHDRQMLEHLAVYIRTILLRDLQENNDSVAEALTSYLAGNTVDKEKARLLLAECSFTTGDSLRCFVIERPPQVLESDHVYLRLRFQRIVPSAASVIYQNHFIGLVNEAKSNWNTAHLSEWITEWLGDNVGPVGVSSGFDSLADLREHYLEAMAAFGFSAKNQCRIMEFADCRLEYVLANCSGDLPHHLLYPPGFNRLLELNHASTVDYLETLRIWLEEGLNDNQTARRLFIRRNSFLYRRERILSCLNMDISDPDVRFYLGLCLRLHAC